MTKIEKKLLIILLVLCAVLVALVIARCTIAEAVERTGDVAGSLSPQSRLTPRQLPLQQGESSPQLTPLTAKLPQEPVIETAEEDVDEPAIETGESRERQLEILALIIYQEQGGDYAGDDARMAVGSVFVNRVTDPRFPSTFEEVALQKQAWGELYWTGIRWPERAKHDSEARAISRAFDCARRVLDGERTVPEGVIYASEFVQGQIYAQCGNTYFCY